MALDIWNPTHGCYGKSEGCVHCYAKTIDDRYKRDFFECKKLDSQFNYPIKKDRNGNYKAPSGMCLRACMNSDFFFEGQDPYRNECWNMMAKRLDILFYLLTKRPERVKECLPKWWDYDNPPFNIMINVTCENQERADERIPILRELPFRFKGIMCAPLLSEIHIEKYLDEGFIMNVNCGGENYDGARPCHYEWVASLSEQCAAARTKFTFIETGNNFFKNGVKVPVGSSKTQQGIYARKLGLNVGEDIKLYFPSFTPTFGKDCQVCGSQPICMGLEPGKDKCY
jgi:protein gp37